MALAFEKVVIVNLKRRPERLAALRGRLDAADWPFAAAEVFEAVDGARLPMPHAWADGPGAWGCLQSHRQVLERAIMAGVESLLILEDDAEPAPHFRPRVERFLAAVPEDWQGLMLGGQHVGRAAPPSIASGVVRVQHCHRTHAYAVRGEYMRALYQHWVSTAGHCDHRAGELQPRWRVYAPDPFLIGQALGKSDISNKVERLRFWAGAGA